MIAFAACFVVWDYRHVRGFGQVTNALGNHVCFCKIYNLNSLECEASIGTLLWGIDVGTQAVSAGLSLAQTNAFGRWPLRGTQRRLLWLWASSWPRGSTRLVVGCCLPLQSRLPSVHSTATLSCRVTSAGFRHFEFFESRGTRCGWRNGTHNYCRHRNGLRRWINLLWI